MRMAFACRKKATTKTKLHVQSPPRSSADLYFWSDSSIGERDMSKYPLRNMNNYSASFAHTEMFKRSCIPPSISLWNAADNSLKESNTLQSFKYHQKRSATINLKMPSYYLSRNRRLSVLHARMQHFNFHLFLNNFLRPDPLCNCLVETENAELYLFRYNSLRNFPSFRGIVVWQPG